MKNIKTLIKNNILFILIEFNLLLSVIGIFTAMAAAKKENYDNPLLFSLPLSVVLWFIFAFLPKPQEKVETEEETESGRKRKISGLQVIIIRSVKKIILAIHILVFLFDVTMMLFMSLKTVAIPAIFSP